MKKLALLMLAIIAPCASAQREAKVVAQPRETSGQQFVVKTVPLKHLSSFEAVKLLSPYSVTPGGGVYDVSPNVRAVTIRETPAVWAQMTEVLNRYDRESATVTLNFGLVEADNTAHRDPALAGVDSLLRAVLKFSGYRQLTSAVINVTEGASAQQTLSGEGQVFRLMCSLSEVNMNATPATVHLSVSLDRDATPPGTFQGAHPASMFSHLLSTGLTIPVGNTVVVGTGASDDHAMILTVRPQISVKR